MFKYSGGVFIDWGIEHRNGICSMCGAQLSQDPKIPPESKKVDRNFCLKCKDYRLGQLISRSCRMIPPDGYDKASDRNTRTYIRRAAIFVLLTKYNECRVAYAESHRKLRIPEKYRTGSPMPHTIRAAVWEIVKLKVMMCF